jgi:hypothetical protein
MLLSPYGQLSQLKTTVNSSLGAVGVGVAATADQITFVEGPIFKTVVGVLGLILLLATLYNIYRDVQLKDLDMQLKKRKLKDNE